MKIQIRYDGDTPGLQNHRYDMDAFGDSFVAIPKAFRVVARKVVNEYLEESDAEKFLKALRIQLGGIYDGCVQLGLETCLDDTIELSVQLPKSLSCTDDLMNLINSNFINEIQSSFDEKDRNNSSELENYYKKLPKDLVDHSYFAIDSSGKVINETRLEGKPSYINKKNKTSSSFRVEHILCKVDGFTGLSSGSIYVRLLINHNEKDKVLMCSCSNFMKSKAYALNEAGEDAIAQVSRIGKKVKLLNIKTCDSAFRKSHDKTIITIFQQWSDVLNELTDEPIKM